MPLDNEFNLEFNKPTNRYLRIGALGITKKDRVPHIVLDDVDVCDYFSDEEVGKYEVNRDEPKLHSNCLENLHPNNNALQLSLQLQSR